MVNIVFICSSPKITNYSNLLNNGGSGTLLSLLNVAHFLSKMMCKVTIVGDLRMESDINEDEIDFVDIKEEDNIRKYLINKNPDITIVVGHALFIINNSSVKISNKVIYWPHNWVDPYELNKLYKEKLVDKIVYVSKYHFFKTWKRIKLNPFFLLYSTYIYNGIDKDFYTKRKVDKNKNLNLAYLSYPSKNKGFPDAIALVRKLIENRIDVKLHLFGDIKLYDENLEDGNDCTKYMLASNGEIEPFLVLHGTIGKNELNEKLSNIDFSIAGLTGSETYCYALVESLAKGIPVISSKTGGQTDYVKHGINGFLVNNIDDAVIHIMKYMKKNNFHNIEKVSKKSIEKFYMEKVGPQWVRLIESIK